MKQKITIVLAVVLVALAVWQVFFTRGDNFEIPNSGDTQIEEIVLDSEGQIIENMNTIETGKEQGENSSETKEESSIFSKKEIMVTDGVRHSVPLDEIIGGGPPKDGIPPIDNPKFVSVSDANDWLVDDEPGISLSIGGVNRFYPYQILVWHEIVNDTIDNQKVLITYCPLCLSGFVFDPIVRGERVEFGTSGKLWKSNLVMYDRKTDTLWSQILGEAILGELTGNKLKVLPSDQILYGNWKKQFPKGDVLSQDTGAIKVYGSNPYGNYFSVANFSLQLAGGSDDRLANDAFIFGVVEGDKAKAYDIEAVKRKGIVEDNFAGNDFILRYDKELDIVRMFKKLSDGTEERVNPFSNFWFSWAAIHPGTELYK